MAFCFLLAFCPRLFSNGAGQSTQEVSVRVIRIKPEKKAIIPSHRKHLVLVLKIYRHGTITPCWMKEVQRYVKFPLLGEMEVQTDELEDVGPVDWAIDGQELQELVLEVIAVESAKLKNKAPTLGCAHAATEPLPS